LISFLSDVEASRSSSSELSPSYDSLEGIVVQPGSSETCSVIKAMVGEMIAVSAVECPSSPVVSLPWSCGSMFSTWGEDVRASSPSESGVRTVSSSIGPGGPDNDHNQMPKAATKLREKLTLPK
jgi:hypothetical protein